MSIFIIRPINYRDDFSAYNADIDVEYNRLFIHFPVAFVHPVDVLDVQNTIKCRTNGHSYENYGLGDKDCYLVIDVGGFNKVTVDVTSQTAIIGTENTLDSYITVYPNMDLHFQLGMGFLVRKFGYSSDNLLDIQMVLANGTIINSVKEHTELL
ncbi:19574_t:CDS:2, partial [Racocetra persica]